MISEEARKFLAELHDYLVPVVGPVASGLVGFMFGRRRDRAEAAQIEANADATALDSITKSFHTMIDGYEQRIADLTAEVTALRDEVRELRQALDKRPRVDNL